MSSVVYPVSAGVLNALFVAFNGSEKKSWVLMTVESTLHAFVYEN